ncbi:MAG: leucyl aminopeptidase [Flavobacteriales bacterium]|nr:leucyl aminopeptidase [Flavobacteriales bacterium]
MHSIIHKADESSLNGHLIILGSLNSDWSKFDLSANELAFIKLKLENGQKSIEINQYSRYVFIECFENNDEQFILFEDARKRGASITRKCNQAAVDDISIIDVTESCLSIYVAEGMALANYQFLKYFTESESKQNALKTINIDNEDAVIRNLNAVIAGTLHARDFVNEPLSYLTALQFSEDILTLGEATGFEVDVLHKKQIEALNMGGLLAVNKGALEPPTFNVLTYNPDASKNSKPIVLVGKGIVYDTGGLSLKPTLNSMDMMKCDLGGAASVVGILCAIAKAEIPVHVVGLIPATENRPGLSAYAPGDVIQMMDGTSVEVLNTDAEGRLVMADALTYAKKYNPELVVDFATLTGAAVRAIGKYGIVAMGTVGSEVENELLKSGKATYERLAAMPFWDEYAELLKSDIADLKNLGPAEAGQITAGKFLEHFTDYPWMHFDIAGPAFLSHDDHYRLKGGTGVGVRMMFDFLLKKSTISARDGSN